MIGHLRVYTINKGMMDAWLELFRSQLVGHMAAAGITVHSTWVNAERTQFIWIRTYGESMADLEAKEKAFYGSPWWQANVDHVRSHIAHRELTVIHTAP
ncbi:MAG: NIPSNAP family protein [Ectothiorhodospiraceae bacterium]|nr:NIPSNAP family protein [Chromatiales bacterium]MCP5156434.1 NIPSNAP family protein [Ectothiorhodospiraceae bacterium]